MARQLRLRDLAGLIVIDFIDMDERKNNASVEKRIKDKLKTDRARIQVGRISGFGLMEMSRQRLRPGMIEATTQGCPHCHGTGLIRSDDNMALNILRQIEEEATRRRSREVLVRCPVGIANFLMNQKREHVAGIETRYGLSVRIEGDPMLGQPGFRHREIQDGDPYRPRSHRAGCFCRHFDHGAGRRGGRGPRQRSGERSRDRRRGNQTQETPASAPAAEPVRLDL